uniref:Uncharacterized protein n=1 Tax=Cajanus cajan TaxID=3821 RepID=A0A151UI38_CAJCA|nr:hypothetical protein KK1_036602 [Cajanus cajan]
MDSTFFYMDVFNEEVNKSKSREKSSKNCRNGERRIREGGKTIHNHFAYALFPPVPISPLGLDKVRSQGFRMENENSHSVPCNAGGHKMYHPNVHSCW